MKFFCSKVKMWYDVNSSDKKTGIIGIVNGRVIISSKKLTVSVHGIHILRRMTVVDTCSFVFATDVMQPQWDL